MHDEESYPSTVQNSSTVMELLSLFTCPPSSGPTAPSLGITGIRMQFDI